MHCDPRPFKGHDPPPHSSSIKGGAQLSPMLLLPEMVPDVRPAGVCRRRKVMFGTWLGFFPEAPLREAHLPSTPGSWPVNGSRTWFREWASQETGAGGPLEEPGYLGQEGS